VTEKFKNILRIAVALLLLYWLVETDRLEFELFLKLGLTPALGGMFFGMGATIFVAMLRWRVLLAPHQIIIEWKEITHLSFMGQFASIFVPGTLGVDAIRAYYLMSSGQYANKKSMIISSIIMDRCTGLLGLFLMIPILSCVAMQFFDLPSMLVYLVGASLVLLVVLMVGMTLVCSLRVFSRLKFINQIPVIAKFAQAMQTYRHQLPSLAKAVFASFIHYTLVIFSAYCGFIAFGSAVDPLVVSSVIPFVILARAVPLTPLGLGVSDSIGEELFSAFGISYGAEVVMLMRLVLMALSALGVFSYLKTFKLNKKITMDEPL